MLQRGHSGDGCDLASTLCKYDLRKGDLFVMSWARVRRVRRGSISSELLMCGGGVRSILLLPLVARCLETIDVCIWRMFVFMSVVVIVLNHDTHADIIETQETTLTPKAKPLKVHNFTTVRTDRLYKTGSSHSLETTLHSLQQTYFDHKYTQHRTSNGQGTH